MKGNKKLLVLAILVLLLTVVFSTYAIYRSSTTVNGTVNAATWSVKVDGTAIESANFTFSGSDLTCDPSTGKNGTIAPGSECYFNVPIDADGSEVDVVIEAALASNSLPDGFTVEANSSKTIIPYDADEGDMEANVRINVIWEGDIDDTTTKDGTDKTAAGTELSIPITLTARQKLSTD